ncbi:hypothetical protein FO519_007847 [Halicephalobus sp. NKZ332]|nr:hypothetical protein FO519_007847 [Halicephalobus sp. NKZ332]
MQQIAGDPVVDQKIDTQKIATIFANTYYTGLYDDRAKYFAESAPYCHHNGVVYNGREAFVSFGPVEKIVIRSINSVLAVTNNILVQVTGHYRLVDDFEFAESFVLSPVGDKHYVISAGCFKWVDKCPPGFRCSGSTSQEDGPVIIENLTQNGIHAQKLDHIEQPVINGVPEAHRNGTNGTASDVPRSRKESDRVQVIDSKEVEKNSNGDLQEDNTNTELAKDDDSTQPKSFSVVHVGDFKFQKKPPNSAIVTDLKKHFATYGKVRHINIPRKVIHGDIPLYLFVEFNDNDASAKIFSEGAIETRGTRQFIVQNVNLPNMKYTGTITISEARPGYNNDEYRPSSKIAGKVVRKDTDEKIVPEKRTILSNIASERTNVPNQKLSFERTTLEKKPSDNGFVPRRSFPQRFKNDSGVKELSNGNSTVTGKSNNPGATGGRNRYTWDEKANPNDLSKMATKNY